MNKKGKIFENIKSVFLVIMAVAQVAVFVTILYLANASSTDVSAQEETQVYERDPFANEPDSPIDIRQFLTESSDEVDNCGDFDLEGFLAAHKWDLNYAHPDHGDYEVDSSVFEGAHATLTLEGYEYSSFEIRDVCGFASIRIQSDYPHDVVNIIGSKSDGVSIHFLIAMQEVFDCISDVRNANHLKESLEAIDGYSLKISVLTYEEADASSSDEP